ncbi:Solute carrier family 2 facilitated glucose transporter member 2 [Colletotrichum gloeosporioides]|uniref:Solute carrier family 2 facilitated glucose transporter member 2 n=1 Tax=Colletotrichum gloeosporioides TaxID=474922 RepID=A0A8H4FFZ3_COLGL|nr:Solute carrier family 2 facilitated glucose transporter member 2 [Colletotrichum gloeosporioides]KAF3799609.1 Solute carrier family 2 facilitated glucose transporter member 2 [Colletotrichum gloeosporioides]
MGLRGKVVAPFSYPATWDEFGYTHLVAITADEKRAGGADPSAGVEVSNIEKSRRGSQATVDLNDNKEAKIKNPLLGINRSELLRDVEHFTHDKSLDEYLPMLKKGALVAQDPTGYEEIAGAEALEPDEIQVLRDEVLHKWRIPKILYLTIITCSIGAAVQGWDQTGSNGANLSFPTVFDIGSNSHHDTLLVGLVNSAPYIGSAFIGCWLSDPLNNLVGRRGTIFFAANFCIWILACRLLLGIGMGAKASTVPIFAAENSPEMWTAFGILAGTAASLAVGEVGDIAWRLQLGSAFIPAVPLALLIYVCPQSPRWYIKKNQYGNAMKSLLRLRNHPIQAARDLYYIHIQLQVEAEIIGRSNYAKRFIELFTIPRVRRATLASFTVMIAQQMCGINIIAFYSSTIFKEAGTSEFNALLASFGFGMVNFLFAWPAIWTIDTFGTFSPFGMAWVVATCLFWAAVLSISFSIMLADLGVLSSFCFYAGLNVIAFVVIINILLLPKLSNQLTCHQFFWVPETKQRTLEELDYVFAVPTKLFMRYQVTKALPYWFKRWILWQRDAILEPLYKFDLTHEDHHAADDDKAQVELRDKKHDTS